MCHLSPFGLLGMMIGAGSFPGLPLCVFSPFVPWHRFEFQGG